MFAYLVLCYLMEQLIDALTLWNLFNLLIVCILELYIFFNSLQCSYDLLDLD